MNRKKLVAVLEILMTYAFLVAFPYLGMCLSLQDKNVWISFASGMIGIAHLAALTLIFRVYARIEES